MGECRRGINVSQVGPGFCVEQCQAMWEAMCHGSPGLAWRWATDAFRGMQLQPPMEQRGPKPEAGPVEQVEAFLEERQEEEQNNMQQNTKTRVADIFRLVELGVEELTWTEVSLETQERDHKTLGRQEEMVLCEREAEDEESRGFLSRESSRMKEIREIKTAREGTREQQPGLGREYL